MTWFLPTWGVTSLVILNKVCLGYLDYQANTHILFSLFQTNGVCLCAESSKVVITQAPLWLGTISVLYLRYKKKSALFSLYFFQEVLPDSHHRTLTCSLQFSEATQEH